MSELTTCNYCSYQDMKRRAKKKKMVTTPLPESFGLGGVRIYVHPKDVDIRKLSKEERKQYDGGAWFMALTDHCCCG